VDGVVTDAPDGGAAPAAATLPAPHPYGPYARRTLVVLNPAAGQESPDRVRRALGAAFAARGASFDVAETAGAGDAERYARDGAELGYRAVVAVGGDGTVGEVITGLAGSGVPLGIVPQGTGNQVAFNLGLPRPVEQAVHVAVNGVAQPMDLGRLADGRYFALAAGAGWDAAVIAAATREMKDRWGFGAYLYAGLRVGLGARPALYSVTADGETLEVEAAMVLVANMGSFASILPAVGMQIAPTVSFHDGKLDVCIFAPRNLTDVAAVLWRMARRRYAGDDRMLFLQAARIRIDAAPAVVTEVDGELLGQTPMEIDVVPGGIHVLVPGP
jgi:YegS/Rv2252/BmrU family lipid kinase